MIVLSIRTDNPESEIGLHKADQEIGYYKWHAHRTLAESLHTKILELLKNTKLQWEDIEGIIVYAGPGSFTGLRIGMSVANALAYSLSIPIVATSGDWLKIGLKKLNSGKSSKIALPDYGSPAHTTTPKS